MSDSIPVSTQPVMASPPHVDVAHPGDPLWARLVGGAAGAVCFGLCVLLVGPTFGVVVAIVAALIARLRHANGASLPFAAAGAICAIAFLAPTTAIALASLAFGAGLTLAARLRPSAASS